MRLPESTFPRYIFLLKPRQFRKTFPKNQLRKGHFPNRFFSIFSPFFRYSFRFSRTLLLVFHNFFRFRRSFFFAFFSPHFFIIFHFRNRFFTITFHFFPFFTIFLFVFSCFFPFSYYFFFFPFFRGFAFLFWFFHDFPPVFSCFLFSFSRGLGCFSKLNIRLFIFLFILVNSFEKYY